MNNAVTPKTAVKTDKGCLPSHVVVAGLSYTTIGRSVIINGGSIPTVATLRSSMFLYSAANNEVIEIDTIGFIGGFTVTLKMPFKSDVTVSETLKVVQQGKYVSLGIIFKNATGVLDGETIPPDVGMNWIINGTMVNPIAYDATGSSMVCSLGISN